MKVPVSVQVSFWMQLALLALGAIRGILVTVELTASGTPPVIAPILFVGVLALWVWIAVRIRQGRAGFRMFVTIAAAVALVLIVIDLVFGIYDYDALVYVDSVVQIAAVVLLWLPESRAYFNRVTLARRETKDTGPVEPPSDAWKPPFSD